MDLHQKAQYPLRIQMQVKARVQSEAAKNRRSLNTELGLLIEEGLMWREQKSKQALA